MDLKEFTEKAIFGKMGCGKEHAAYSDCLVKAKVYHEDSLVKCAEVAYTMFDCVGSRQDELNKTLDAADLLFEKKAEEFVTKYQGQEFFTRSFELFKQGPCKETLTKVYEKSEDDVVIRKATFECMQDNLDYYLPLSIAAKLVQDKILSEDNNPFE